MLLTKNIDVKICSKNIKHFQSLGYKVNVKDIINIPINELTLGSHLEVDIRCDYCGKKIKRTYKDYIGKSDGIIKKDCCSRCIGIKSSESFYKIYGVQNCMHLDSVKQKIEQTNINRYGVKNISQTNLYGSAHILM